MDEVVISGIAKVEQKLRAGGREGLEGGVEAAFAVAGV